jgi:hypothetical protein
MLAVAIVASTFALQPGQTRTFTHAEPGDVVVCRELRASVPRPTKGAVTFQHTFDKRLALSLRPLRTGGVRATCERR